MPATGPRADQHVGQASLLDHDEELGPADNKPGSRHTPTYVHFRNRWWVWSYWFCRPVIKLFKANGLKWKGWHAYRRGLATNLHELGVPDVVIQAILRHEDIRTTQRSYIKTVPRVISAAMKRLQSQVACTAVVQRQPPSNLVD
jgi:integrase